MNLLLDMHVFLWFIAGDPRLSLLARTYIEDPANHSFVSTASLWEIAIKYSLGKLQLLLPLKYISRNRCRLTVFQPSPFRSITQQQIQVYRSTIVIPLTA